MNTKHLRADLSASLHRYLDSVPPVSKEELAELGRAVGELDTDPAFQADFMKGRFIEQILEAMMNNGQNQNQIAEAWGKSRQYVSKLFNEDERVNFTIETMAQLAAIVGRRLRLELETPGTCAVPGRKLNLPTFMPRDLVKQNEKQPTSMATKGRGREKPHPQVA